MNLFSLCVIAIMTRWCKISLIYFGSRFLYIGRVVDYLQLSIHWLWKSLVQIVWVDFMLSSQHLNPDCDQHTHTIPIACTDDISAKISFFLVLEIIPKALRGFGGDTGLQAILIFSSSANRFGKTTLLISEYAEQMNSLY